MIVQDIALNATDGPQLGTFRKVMLSLDEWAALCEFLAGVGLDALARPPGESPIVVGNCIFVLEPTA